MCSVAVAHDENDELGQFFPSQAAPHFQPLMRWAW